MKYLILSLLLTGIAACKNNDKPQEQIMIFAGVGMKNAVAEIIDSFNIQYSNVKVLCNWAPSGILAKQISQGQIPDVFISANKKWVNYVDSLGLIVNNKIMAVAGNALVLIVPKNCKTNSICFDKNTDFDKLLNDGFLSIGDPLYVPVGEYAKQSLEFYDLYSKVKSRLMPARDVRSALWLVELGEAPAGIVFRSEIINSDKVKEITIIPSESHKPINFIVTQCKNNKLARDFYGFLDTKKARDIWVRHGFY